MKLTLTREEDFLISAYFQIIELTDLWVDLRPSYHNQRGRMVVEDSSEILLTKGSTLLSS